jgi:hypothetical protein
VVLKSGTVLEVDEVLLGLNLRCLSRLFLFFSPFRHAGLGRTLSQGGAQVEAIVAQLVMGPLALLCLAVAGPLAHEERHFVVFPLLQDYDLCFAFLVCFRLLGV